MRGSDDVGSNLERLQTVERHRTGYSLRLSLAPNAKDSGPADFRLSMTVPNPWLRRDQTAMCGSRGTCVGGSRVSFAHVMEVVDLDSATVERVALSKNVTRTDGEIHLDEACHGSPMGILLSI